MTKTNEREAQVTQIQETTKYHREELLANAEALFNVKPEVLLGALNGYEQQELSVEEMRKVLDDFLKRRVK